MKPLGSSLRASGAFALLLLSACVSPRGLPAFRTIVGEDDAVRARVERAIGEAEARRTLRAVGKLSVTGPRGSGDVKQVILVERPARLRLESLNVLGQAATLLVTDGERYAFYERVKKAYAIVVTGELEPWGNFILRKGVLCQALRP